MVRSLNSIAYSLVELFRANFRNTDSVDIRLFKNFVQQTRAQIIKQRLDSGGYIDDALVQDLGIVTFIPIDSSSISSIPSDKYMMRSIVKLPPTINRKNNIGTFTRIGSADGLERKFNLVPRERALISGNGRFNNNDIYVFQDSGYLYLISKSNLHKYITKVNVRGIFVNPEDAYTFNTAISSVTPWSDDLEYPISESVLSDIENIILSTKFKFLQVQVDDKLSNGSDETTVTRLK